VTLDDNIFIIGGFTAPDQVNNITKPVLSTLERLNSTGGWVTLSPMLEARYHAACSLYTFEGHTIFST
jgi:hypothetical protein